jgi:hypothetical protein
MAGGHREDASRKDRTGPMKEMLLADDAAWKQRHRTTKILWT